MPARFRRSRHPPAQAADPGCLTIGAALCRGTACHAEGTKVSETAEKVWRPSAVAGAGSFLLLAATGKQVRSGVTARQGQQSGTRRSVSSQPEKMLYTI